MPPPRCLVLYDPTLEGFYSQHWMENRFYASISSSLRHRLSWRPQPQRQLRRPLQKNFSTFAHCFFGYRRKGALGTSDLPLSLFLPCRLNDNRCSLVFGARHCRRSRTNGVGNELTDPGPYSKWLSLARHDEPLTIIIQNFRPTSDIHTPPQHQGQTAR